MSLKMLHTLVSERFDPQTHLSDETVFFTVGHQVKFSILYPGRLFKNVTASIRNSSRVDSPPEPLPGVPQPLHDGVQVVREEIPLDVRIFDPDGHEFTSDEVTLDDLRKFRDLRGMARGHWLCTVLGRSRTFTPTASIHETISDPQGIIDISLGSRLN